MNKSTSSAIVPYQSKLPAVRPLSALAISPRVQQGVAVAVMLVGVVALALRTAQRLSRALKTQQASSVNSVMQPPIVEPEPSPIPATFTPNPEHIRLEMRVQVVRVRRYIP